MDRFDNMRVFARVVESGSFAGAAARLGISASMVTQHVKQLEERLGARLLHRTTRKIGLTEVGRAYHERCTRLLADLEETERAVMDLQAAPREALRVNANPTFGSSHLAPAISDFLARFPGISIELMLSDRLVDMVEQGFDIAVRAELLPDTVLACASARSLSPGDLRRAELSRRSWNAAQARRSGQLQLPHADDRAPPPYMAVHSRRWRHAARLARRQSALQQPGGAPLRCARRTRLGPDDDLFRGRVAALGRAGHGAG